MKTKKNLLMLFALMALLSITAAAASQLPIGILRAQEYNQAFAQDVLKNVSFFIAFLAGVTSIVSPCILPMFPAYFAITFKEKKRITFATSLFFIGFASVFIAMGMLATLAGRTLVTVFSGFAWVIPLAGAALIIFGIMVFLGRGFTGIAVRRKFGNDWKGLIVSGALFAVGWTACIGPIISGVLLMVSTFQNYGTGAAIMFFYALGIFAPLFIMSFFHNKLHLEKIQWLQKRVKFRIKGKNFLTSYPNIIAGTLFVMLGFVFIIFNGTRIVNGLQMFGLKQYFYDWQNMLLKNAALFNKIGIAVFLLFFFFLAYFLRKELKAKGGKK